jgi:hypothetical protein
MNSFLEKTKQHNISLTFLKTLLEYWQDRAE